MPERDQIACSNAARTRSACIERATRQPMIRRANTSITARHVHEAGPRPDVCEVCYPQLIAMGRLELTIDVVHDFLEENLGKAIPYGVYDLSENKGWVSVGIDHDTARFAAEAIRRWWKKMGAKRYRNARELLITAHGGGSNGSRSRLWKLALQELATKLEMPIQVCHFPPGTSKWNKIEHRMFCHITQNRRGRPLVSHEVIIQLIANPSWTRAVTHRHQSQR